MAENDASATIEDVAGRPDRTAARGTSRSTDIADDADGDARPMKAEAWIFGICTVFFVLVAPGLLVHHR